MSEDRWKGLVALAKSPGGAAILGGLTVGLVLMLWTGRINLGQLWGQTPQASPSALTERQVRSALSSVLRRDVIPRLEGQEAGLKALASFEKAEVKFVVLQAMVDAREKAQKEAQKREEKEGLP